MQKVTKKIIISTLVVIISAVFLVGLSWLYKKQHAPIVKPVIVQKIVDDSFLSFPSSVYSLDAFNQLDKQLDEAFRYNTLIFDNLMSNINHDRLSSTLQEDAKQFTVSINVPGINPKAIHITLQNRIICITASKNSQSYFYYRFSLPDTADSEKITAQIKRGVLEIRIPKLEKTPSKEIAIQET